MHEPAQTQMERTRGLPQPLRTGLQDDPQSEYEHRLENRRRSRAHYEMLDNWIAAARGFTFLATLILLYLTFGADRVSAWWLTLPIAVFITLIVLHGQVARRIDRARRAIAHYERGLERLAHRWIGVGVTGDRYLDPHHMYAGDLDIFGRGSLFQLLSTARTRLGEDTLAEWLLNPADGETVRKRQAAVAELRHHLDLRESFALLDAEVHDELDQNRLLRWSQETPQPVSRTRRVVAVLFAVALIAAVFAWTVLDAGLSPVLLVLAAESLFLFSFRRHLRSTTRTADEAGSGLAILAQVLAVIERERFETPYLQEMRAALETDGRPPSKQIVRLQNLIQNLNNCLQNQFFAPLAFALCLPVHLVHAVEEWRTRFGPSIPDWLRAVGEIEALSALGGYAYEHPRDPFPEIVGSGPRFDAEGLGHPLLAEDKCVRNDVELGVDLQLIMVSGSNMSGKSTLLRSVGTNAVLALAGAPVRANSLRVSPFLIGTAMRVNDSLQEGASLFYSVISRIKSVVELSGREIPLLFLLDEILQGTNSHDRRVGAEAIIRQLIERGAVGLVTTHDLALTEIVSTFGTRAINVHFEDRLVEGRMTFDYQMRPGIVRRSNALELMRMVGLEIDDVE